jgi:uncharacterized protein YwqG
MEIPPFRLIAEPETDAARAAAGFAWAEPEVGKRHRLGGAPEWLQGDATPRCPDCGEPMTFYAQLDSIGDDIVLADVGLLYVFVCFDDFETRSVLQSG